MKKDYLIEIYKVEAEKYNKTRDIHWRINIAIWTILIVLIYAKLEHRIMDLEPFQKGVIFIIFLLLHFIFITKIHGSLNRSLRRLHNLASYLLEKDENEDIKWTDFDKKVNYKKSYWEFWQLVITGFLIYIFYIIN